MSEQKELEFKKLEDEYEVWAPVEVNDKREGVVVELTEDEYSGKIAKLKQKDNSLVHVKISANLRAKITPALLDKFVRIVYTGLKPATVEGHSDTKLFDVLVPVD